jgi:hypothetical protein
MLSFIPSFEKSDEQFNGNRMFNMENNTYAMGNITRDENSIIPGGDDAFNQTNS